MDNILPLDCAFKCSETVGDITVVITNSSNTTTTQCSGLFVNNIVRLLGTLLNLVVLTIITFFFGSAYLTRNFEEKDFVTKCSGIRKNSVAPESQGPQGETLGMPEDETPEGNSRRPKTLSCKLYKCMKNTSKLIVRD